MVLDLAVYRKVQRPVIAGMIKLRGKPGLDLLGDIALATEMHILACAHFVGEIEGYTPELENKIAIFEQFYRPITVLNTERGQDEPVL